MKRKTLSRTIGPDTKTCNHEWYIIGMDGMVYKQLALKLLLLDEWFCLGGWALVIEGVPSVGMLLCTVGIVVLLLLLEIGVERIILEIKLDDSFRKSYEGGVVGVIEPKGKTVSSNVT
ncbi:hypothetical protein Tco_1205124, partial [Tanacetum coccineum]